jgi:hypothetical protein
MESGEIWPPRLQQCEKSAAADLVGTDRLEGAADPAPARIAASVRSPSLDSSGPSVAFC